MKRFAGLVAMVMMLGFCVESGAQNPNVTLAGTLQGPNGLPLSNTTIALEPTQVFYVAGLGSSTCSGYILQVNATALVCADTVNFNGSTPAAPSNGINVTWNKSTAGLIDSVSAALVGDGNASHCFLGNGTFGTCPSSGLTDPGANGIIKRTALNTTAAATAADVVALFSTCSGTQYLGADGACHSGAGITGTGTTGRIPEWTGASALGDSPLLDVAGSPGSITDNAFTYILHFRQASFGDTSSGGQSNILGVALGAKSNLDIAPCDTVNSCFTSQFNASNHNAASLNGDYGALFLNAEQNAATQASQGSMEALFVQSNRASFGSVTSQAELYGIKAISGNSQNSSGVTVGKMFTASLVNISNGVVTVGGALYAQSQVTNFASNTITNDKTIFIDAPIFLGSGIATHHYGLYIGDQTAGGGTVNPDPHGITVAKGGIQHLATTFASLPTCAAAYEGTIWAVTDSNTATWGATIAGSSTNHVLAYCDGTNWTVAAK